MRAACSLPMRHRGRESNRWARREMHLTRCVKISYKKQRLRATNARRAVTDPCSYLSPGGRTECPGAAKQPLPASSAVTSWNALPGTAANLAKLRQKSADFDGFFGLRGLHFRWQCSNFSPIRRCGRTYHRFSSSSLDEPRKEGGKRWPRNPSPKAAGKSEVFANIATTTGLAKKDVAAVFDALTAEIGKALGKKGNGAFQIPGLCKIILSSKPAQPAKKGVPNPFKPGELMDVAAKPAKNVVKVRPLKGLKGDGLGRGIANCIAILQIRDSQFATCSFVRAARVESVIGSAPGSAVREPNHFGQPLSSRCHAPRTWAYGACMNRSKLRRQIAWEAARLMYLREESEYYRAKQKAAHRICQGWVKPADLPSNAEIRDQIQSFARLHEGRRPHGQPPRHAARGPAPDAPAGPLSPAADRQRDDRPRPGRLRHRPARLLRHASRRSRRCSTSRGSSTTSSGSGSASTARSGSSRTSTSRTASPSS